MKCPDCGERMTRLGHTKEPQRILYICDFCDIIWEQLPQTVRRD